MKRRLFGHRGRILALLVLLASGRAPAEEPGVRDTQKETIPLTSPEQAVARFNLPEGFRVSLFAAEPDVRQPIAIATDPRGRLWVAENNTYAESGVNFDSSQRDRIVILDDTDHDGRSDRRTVFWDQAEKLTSVEVGFGGVWALCPPHLLFIPDRDGDDRPDGAPEVVLDGWNADDVRHNIANGLRWGPDGWLYGRHGILATSHVGKPGSTPAERTPINCGIWRYHPTRKVFEVVCRGTTNPWGMDWNDLGEPFFINTVIGHLWHALPGAHYQRMYGEDFNPYLYRLMPQTADHVHWDTSAESWDDIRALGVTPTTDRAGGGHAHSGLMFYLGDNWPDAFRDAVFTINLHGRRLNQDRLKRQGAGYVGVHAADLLKTDDPWFRAVDLIYGNDGGVYIADWSDIGECHENDGVHRSSGRIYKVTYQQPPRPDHADLTALSNAELVGLLNRRNDWYVRQSRRILQERAASGQSLEDVHAQLKTLYEQEKDVRRKLRALWCLHVTGGTDRDFLIQQLNAPNEHIRSWAVRLLMDDGEIPEEIISRLVVQARDETSGLVLLYLASALQRIKTGQRWGLAEALAAHDEFAADPALPLMIWYGIEPAVPENPSRAVALAGSSGIPLISQFIARRLTGNLERVPKPVDELVTRLGEVRSTDTQRAILVGMTEALQGFRKIEAPESWESARKMLSERPDEELRRLTRELSVVFGDGRALEELKAIATAKTAALDSRRNAIRVLVEAQADELTPLLHSLLVDRDLAADAVRGLAAFETPSTPKILLDRYRNLPQNARADAIVTLSARPSYARVLLDAVARGSDPSGRRPHLPGASDGELSG